MAQPLNNWSNGVPVLPLDNGHKGDLDIWANGAPAVKNPKKNARLGVDGVAAASAAGTVTASIAIAITLTGQQTDSAAGTVTTTADASSDLTGLEAAAEVGSVEVTTPADETPAEPALGVGGGSTGLRKYWRSVRRRPDPVRFDAWVTLRGAEACGEVGQVRCQSSAEAQIEHLKLKIEKFQSFAAVSACAHIFPRGVAAAIRLSPSRVRAIRNPTDEELMLTHLSLIE